VLGLFFFVSLTHAHPAYVPQAHLSSLNAEELTMLSAPNFAIVVTSTSVERRRWASG